MKLFTVAQERQLIQNYMVNREQEEPVDFKPVIKLFGGGACTWLFTEYDPESRTFFGLCDLGVGFPELGYVSREELEALRFPPFGLPVERDLSFKADKTLSQYAEEARKAERILA